jgi:hypothetical protein
VIELHSRRFAADEKSIAQFESVNRLALPADYRDFLLKTNGGVVEPCWVLDISEEPPTFSAFPGAAQARGRPVASRSSRICLALRS